MRYIQNLTSISASPINNTSMSSAMMVNGDLLVTGNVIAYCNAIKPKSDEMRFATLSIEARDGWFGVPVEVVHSRHGKTEGGLQHEEVERQVKLWLADNVEHRYVVLRTSIQFKHEDDAMAFYLRFSGGVVFSE